MLWKNPQPTFIEYRNEPDAVTLPEPWVQATPEEAAAWEAANVPVIPVPEEVTRRQLFLALYRLNPALTRDVLRAQLADEPSRIEFDEAGTFQRGHPLIASFAAGLGLTPEQVDQLFVNAATL